MAIYGTPLTMGGGGGGQNETLPPLLDNFKATRLEGGIVPPTANTLAFKDIPDGSKIKLVKGSKISGTVTYGTTTDLNHRIVFDSNDWTKKEFQLENDSGHNNISGSDIDQWLNATKASGWWTNQSTNTTSPDYANEQGFLYQLGITDELLAQNFNDININETAKAKVGLPWVSVYGEEIPYTFFENISMSDFGRYGFLHGVSGELVDEYDKSQAYTPKAPSLTTIHSFTGKIHPMMEPKPETPVALDSDGSYFMFEKQTSIVLSADKMPVSRANALAGAVWVYGEHEPKNVNDGTKINLTREEIVADSGTIEKSVSWDKKKEFHARQFTYNPKKQYQTMLEGAIAYLPIMPDGQELSKLPSKSKIKLGKWNNTVLKWIVCRDTSDNQVRLILDGSSYNVLGEKQFDAPEPSNSNSDRRSSGNNRYIWSNMHQWLNSNKPANQWYTSQHGADAPPNYANQNGFLNQWTEKEIKSLEFANWTVTKSSVDGSGSETFRSRVTLASTTELGLESGTGGGKLDIMNSNGDRGLGNFYWCRTPHLSFADSVRGVNGVGSLYFDRASYAFGVRPLCKPLSNILVSLEPDSEGCYTIV